MPADYGARPANDAIAMTLSTRYRHTGFVLVRATTDPGDLDLPTL